MSDEASFTIDIQTLGASQAQLAAESVETLSERLEKVSKAVQVASKSYATAESTADRAAKALERVSIAADAQRAKLKAAQDAGNSKAADAAAAALYRLTQRQNEAGVAAFKAKVALDQEAAALDKLKAHQANVDKALKGKEGDGEEVRFGLIKRGIDKLGGPLADMTNRGLELGEGFNKLSKQFGVAGAGALGFAGAVLGAVGILVAFTAAIVTSTIKIAVWAVQLADANRNALQLAQGMLRSTQGAEALNDKINFLARRLPLAREEITGMAQNLANAGLRGDALQNALQRTAIQAAKLKFGPQFEEQMLSLDEQSKVLQANLQRLFGGLKIEGLLKALQRLGQLFDADTESGKAIKVVFETLFQPLIDQVTKAAPTIERFFLNLEIMALKALIAIKPYGSAIASLFDYFKLIPPIIERIVGGFLTLALWVGIGAKKLQDIGRMGGDIMQGLADGITNGGPLIVKAMEGAVSGAVDAAKKLLGIASPSKVMEAEVGFQMGAGVAQGLDRSASSVESSLQGVLAPPAVAPPAGAPAGGGGGRSVDLSNVNFVFHGVKDAEGAKEDFLDLLLKLLEGDTAQLGAMQPST